MDKSAITETINALETAALDAWHKGNPSPYLELYSKDFTYFDPAHERRLDGWDKIKKLYESMHGKLKMEICHSLCRRCIRRGALSRMDRRTSTIPR